MNLELTEQQASVLRDALRHRVESLERELVHTDSRDFRREVRDTLDATERLLQQLIIRSEGMDAYA